MWPDSVGVSWGGHPGNHQHVSAQTWTCLIGCTLHPSECTELLTSSAASRCHFRSRRRAGHAGASWDDVLLFSHYIYSFIEWVLVYVFVCCCVARGVHTPGFPRWSPREASALHTLYNCFSKLAHPAVPGLRSPCGELIRLFQCRCPGVLDHSRERVTKVLLSQKPHPRAAQAYGSYPHVPVSLLSHPRAK